ncbi:PIN domain-containing protein [Arthrobacter sp.]|uniref:PIN domain-containing protein n=1 Tax=Arthrobacter sp. TaxID=1667 RepID=UPI00289B53FB|nr:PIN domain-containing protein [Arthrobacter sp.]
MSGPAGLLLDTPVVAEVRGASPDPDVVSFLRSRSHLRVFVSAVTIGELDSPENPAGWLDELIRRFSGNILPVDHQVALRWRTLPEVPQSAETPPGDTRGALRSLIAATAMENGLAVITPETAAFAAYGAYAVSPFRPSGAAQGM